MVLRRVFVTRDSNLGAHGQRLHHIRHLLRQLVGRIEVVTVNLHIDSTLARNAALRSRHVDVVGAYLGILVQDGTHAVADLGKGAFALGLLHQRNVHRDIVRTVVLHRGESIVGIGLTLGKVHRNDLGIRLAETVAYLQRQLARDLLRRTCGQLDSNAYTGIVLHGEELGRV